MNTHCCCHNTTAQHRPGPRPSTPLQRLWLAVKWAAPGAILIAMPKCPLCVAAYIALFTGVSISFSTAAHLRILAIVLCFATFILLAAKSAAGRRRVASE